MKVDYTGNVCVFMGNCECPIMQYTGLKDKNGKEVFEGDIVIPSSYSVDEYPKKFFKDCVVKDLEWAFSNKSIFNEYKVVGNIYENTELLSE